MMERLADPIQRPTPCGTELGNAQAAGDLVGACCKRNSPGSLDGGPWPWHEPLKGDRGRHNCHGPDVHHAGHEQERSASVSRPSRPSKMYTLSTFTHGSSRRFRLRSSRSRVNSFSFANRSVRAASQTSRGTTGWSLIPPLLSFAIFLSPCRSPSLPVNRAHRLPDRSAHWPRGQGAPVAMVEKCRPR
jgi:hypothetical protein